MDTTSSNIFQINMIMQNDDFKFFIENHDILLKKGNYILFYTKIIYKLLIYNITRSF